MPFIVIYREAAIVRRSGKLFVWKTFDIPVTYLQRISLFIKAACSGQVYCQVYIARQLLIYLLTIFHWQQTTSKIMVVNSAGNLL